MKDVVNMDRPTSQCPCINPCQAHHNLLAELEQRLYKTNEDAVLLEERVAVQEYKCEKLRDLFEKHLVLDKKVEERVDSHRQTLAKQAGNAMDLEQRVAALEKAYASWLPDWAATQERVASLEARCEELLVWAWGKSPDTENRLPRGPHD